MEQYIINLFQNMSLLTGVLLCAGVLLCVAEIFVPKIGLIGVLGMIMIASGLSSYYVDGFGGTQLITMGLIIAVILALFIMIELILESKGVIKNPKRHEFRTYNQPSLIDLVGKTGFAYTNIDLGGTIDVDGKLYYAISDSPINQGSSVKIIGVDNNSLVVKGV